MVTGDHGRLGDPVERNRLDGSATLCPREKVAGGDQNSLIRAAGMDVEAFLSHLADDVTHTRAMSAQTG